MFTARPATHCMKVKRQNVQKSMSIEAPKHLVSNCNDDRIPQRTTRNDDAQIMKHMMKQYETDIYIYIIYIIVILICIVVHHDADYNAIETYLAKSSDNM